MKTVETPAGEFVKTDKDEPQMLYEILLDEYKLLGILNESQLKEIRDYDEKITRDFVLKSDEYINEQYFGEKEREKQKRKQFILRGYHRLEMLSEIRRKIHAKENEKHPVALCLSGGGIRSATFGLGVLQGLAKHNLLDQFDYLSTVSGGGYIGSWLSAWIHRAGSVSRVQAELKNEKNKTPRDDEKKEKPDEVEPPEITYLRSYSNYMSPRIGVFSVDTWTLIVIYLRNLLLNWTVSIPLIAATLMLPKLLVAISKFDLADANQFIISTIIIGIGLFGFVNLNAMRPSLSKFSWVRQNYNFDDIGVIKSSEPKVLWLCLIPLLILAFGITTFWAQTKGRPEYPLSNRLPDSLKLNIELTYFILFSVFLFLFSFLIARWIIYILGNKENSIKLWGTFISELLLTVVSGAIGGALLYLIAVGLSKLCSLVSGELSHMSVPFRQADADSIAQMIYVCFSAPLFLTVFLLAATFFVGVVSKINTDMDREWVARFGAWVLIIIVAWSVISSVVLFNPLFFEIDWKAILASIGIGGISGLVTLILGFSRLSAEAEEKVPQSRTSFLLWFAPQIAAPIFALFLIILISYGTSKLLKTAEISGSKYFILFWCVALAVIETNAALLTRDINISKIYKCLILWALIPTLFISLLLLNAATANAELVNLITWFIIFVGIGSSMGWFININKFSLHAIYRERLIRAYLGASRTTERLITANSFTDLDSEKDNLEMKDLRAKPFHVVNMTLNLAKSSALQWQNRKAESFTATALHCGSSNMGAGSGSYRRSENYA